MSVFLSSGAQFYCFLPYSLSKVKREEIGQQKKRNKEEKSRRILLGFLDDVGGGLRRGKFPVEIFVSLIERFPQAPTIDYN